MCFITMGHGSRSPFSRRGRWRGYRLKAFGQFAAGEHQDVELLGRGISEALVTTAWGLSIAIPCLVFVHVFRHRLITLERATFPEVALSIHRHLAAAPEEPRRTDPVVAAVQP